MHKNNNQANNKEPILVNSTSKNVDSILTSSTDSLEEGSDCGLEALLSDSSSESSCDSLDSKFGAITLFDKVKGITSNIHKEFKVNLKDTAQENIVLHEEVKKNPNKYYVFLTKGDRLDYFKDHSSRREYVKKSIDETCCDSSSPYCSQALESISLRPETEQGALKEKLNKSALLTIANLRSYISPKGFGCAVLRMGNGLGNPWLSTSKSSTLSTRYAEAVKYNSEAPKLHPHYNYTPRKRTLFTAIEKGKLKAGWKVFWQKSEGDEFEGLVIKCEEIKEILTLHIKGLKEKESFVIKINQRTGEISNLDGTPFGDAKLNVLAQRPKERGRPKHRLIGMKTVFVFEANEYLEMDKADVEYYRHRKEIKGKCAVERENYEVIIPYEVLSENIAGRMPLIYPDISQKTEKIYGLIGFQRSRPRNDNGDLSKDFKAENISPEIEKMEFKLALRHAQKNNPDAELLWVDKVGTFRRVQCNEI